MTANPNLDPNPNHPSLPVHGMTANPDLDPNPNLLYLSVHDGAHGELGRRHARAELGPALHQPHARARAALTSSGAPLRLVRVRVG